MSFSQTFNSTKPHHTNHTYPYFLFPPLSLPPHPNRTQITHT